MSSSSDILAGIAPRLRRDSFTHEALKSLSDKNNALLETALPEDKSFYSKNFEGFQSLFHRFLNERREELVWDEITPLPSSFIHKMPEQGEISEADAQKVLNKLIVVKLNGGLGTSMGCVGPKSAITVKSGLTFLDITVEQISTLNEEYNVNIPLVLMNSFNTDEDTKNILRKYATSNVDIHSFNQSKYPRINQETLMPFATSVDSEVDKQGWYPPGHGDLYTSLYNSGLVDELLNQGKEYIFVSNIDNLGATVNVALLKGLMEEKYDYAMELTDKTPSDVKGGTLIQYREKIRLLEIAQVPPDRTDDFKSVKKFKLFNTNNLWMKLASLKQVVEDNNINLDIIVNKKTLDDGNKIIQLETAVGSGIKCFNRTTGVHVTRDRFLPVKTTSDLLLVMSNLYTLERGLLRMSEKRRFGTTPLVKLDREFAKMAEFNWRIAQVPDIIHLEHLTVSGNVTFGKRVALRGTVIIIANHGGNIDIPTGSELEDKIVSGNLQIRDH